jgi:hypothetical protein
MPTYFTVSLKLAYCVKGASLKPTLAVLQKTFTYSTAAIKTRKIKYLNPVFFKCHLKLVSEYILKQKLLVFDNKKGQKKFSVLFVLLLKCSQKN